jgi:hypothetical protein
MRVTKRLRGARVAGATVLALCLAWCCTSCGRLPSSPGLKSTPCPPGGAAGHGERSCGPVCRRQHPVRRAAGCVAAAGPAAVGEHAAGP